VEWYKRWICRSAVITKYRTALSQSDLRWESGTGLGKVHGPGLKLFYSKPKILVCFFYDYRRCDICCTSHINYFLKTFVLPLCPFWSLKALVLCNFTVFKMSLFCVQQKKVSHGFETIWEWVNELNKPMHILKGAFHCSLTWKHNVLCLKHVHGVQNVFLLIPPSFFHKSFTFIPECAWKASSVKFKSPERILACVLRATLSFNGVRAWIFN